MRIKAILAAAAIIALALAVAVFAIWYMMNYGGGGGGSSTEGLYVDSLLSDALNGRPNTINVSSPAFGFNETIPARYTCDGEDLSPPLVISNVPPGTKSLVIIMYDPDAPSGTFYHWILYNVDGGNITLPEGIPKEAVTEYGLQGVNDFGTVGYGGPCPPPGLGKHRYYILVIALDTVLDIGPGASKEQVINALKGHVLAYGYYMGVYERK